MNGSKRRGRSHDELSLLGPNMINTSSIAVYQPELSYNRSPIENVRTSMEALRIYSGAEMGMED